jgi:hypothetical protein
MGFEPTPASALDRRAAVAFEAEMKRQGLDLADYTYCFYECEDSWLVFTEAKARKPGQRGSAPGFPEIEARISKATFEVTEVHGVK